MGSRSDGVQRGEASALWVGLLVAFSPTLLDLARHIAESPWTHYSLLFPFLFARCALNEPERPPRRRDGILWVGLGMGVELYGIFAGATRIGRIGLALAAIGLCRRFGLASGPSLVLLALAVPLPSAVLRWTSPGAEDALLAAASGLLGALGLVIEIDGTRALYGAQQIALERIDGGVPLAVLLVGLSWYHSRSVGTAMRKALVRAVTLPLLAVPVQILAIALALGTLALGAAVGGRVALTHLPWMVVAAVGLTMTERSIRRRGPIHDR